MEYNNSTHTVTFLEMEHMFPLQQTGSFLLWDFPNLEGTEEEQGRVYCSDNSADGRENDVEVFETIQIASL